VCVWKYVKAKQFSRSLLKFGFSHGLVIPASLKGRRVSLLDTYCPWWKKTEMQRTADQIKNRGFNNRMHSSYVLPLFYFYASFGVSNYIKWVCTRREVFCCRDVRGRPVWTVCVTGDDGALLPIQPIVTDLTRESWHTALHYGILFRRCLVRIPTMTRTIVTEVLLGFSLPTFR
jgi:hypothetical protein